jgi:hypothetical protein
MTLSGWIMMGLTVSASTGLLVWCVIRVLRTPQATRHLHSLADIDPKDD